MQSLLTSDDLFLFNQGTHYRLYEKLGAHVVTGGTHFAVWAPNAERVAVVRRADLHFREPRDDTWRDASADPRARCREPGG